jgi:hypothetical protein
MKQTSVFLLSFLIALSINAQQNSSAVTIVVDGNKNLQVSVGGGSEYNPNNNTISGNSTTIVLNTLSVGQHSLLITRTDEATNRPTRISTSFILRYGYDMSINLNEDGSLELIEARKTGISNNPPMSDDAFNILLRNARSQRSANSRRTLIANAFENVNNYFTTYQVVQLLQVVNSENFRLQLAKSFLPGYYRPGQFQPG